MYSYLGCGGLGDGGDGEGGDGEGGLGLGGLGLGGAAIKNNTTQLVLKLCSLYLTDFTLHHTKLLLKLWQGITRNDPKH